MKDRVSIWVTQIIMRTENGLLADDAARLVRYLINSREVESCLIYGEVDQYTDYSNDRGRTTLHRALYKAIHGPVSDDEVIRHRCDTPGCINPGHLVAGSTSQNVRDAYDRHRASLVRAKGSEKVNAKLNDELVTDIRKRAKGGELVRDIAAELAVSYETAWAAIHGKTWKHVAEEPLGPVRQKKSGGSRAKVDLSEAAPVARRLWEQGVNYRTISAQVGVSTNVITRWSREWKSDAA